MRERNRGSVKQKLTSEKGASLLVALLFFLICACVGPVILAAASTSAGRVSSIESSGNANRYAVNSAVKLIKEEMSEDMTSDEDMSFNVQQTWEASYTQADFQTNGDAGIPTLTSGSWVLDKNGDGWSSMVKTFNEGTFDISSLINNTNTTKADLYQIRDMMAYEIYLHYWNDISAHDGETSDEDPDPWSSIAMGEEDWQNVLDEINEDEESDGTYEITTSEPYVISLKDDEDMPTVYALFSMDSTFTMTIELYCLDDDGNKAEDRFLIYTPEQAVLTRTSDETLAGTETNDSFTLENGTVISNTTYTYDLSRSVNLSLRWDKGTISTKNVTASASPEATGTTGGTE
jgi:hypothetical protein